jgi:hypothetical protein
VKAGKVYIALLHGPVYDKKGRVSVTSIVNTDIHDIARCARTFGVARFYIATPIEGQRKLADAILRHWQSGFGSVHNPSRKEAFSLVELQESLDGVLNDIHCRTGRHARIIVTGAHLTGPCISVATLRGMVRLEKGPFLFLFGTGWGLAREVLERADFQLEPIRGHGTYNHLPVRAAVAIFLDRLWGR